MMDFFVTSNMISKRDGVFEIHSDISLAERYAFKELIEYLKSYDMLFLNDVFRNINLSNILSKLDYDYVCKNLRTNFILDIVSDYIKENIDEIEGIEDIKIEDFLDISRKIESEIDDFYTTYQIIEYVYDTLDEFIDEKVNDSRLKALQKSVKKKLTQEELNVLLDKCKRGIVVQLSDLDLSGLDFSNRNLFCIQIFNSICKNANFSNSNCAASNFVNVDVEGANFKNTNFYCANIEDTKFSEEQINQAKWLKLYCPEECSFYGYKNLVTRYGEFAICKLEIPTDAKRSNATSRDCRCSYAKVLEILKEDNEGNYTIPIDEGFSIFGKDFDFEFKYTVGEYVYPDKWDDDRWNKNSHGIHFFMTKEEAEEFQ